MVEVSQKNDWVTGRVLGMIDIQQDIFDASIATITSDIELQRAYRGSLENNRRKAPIAKVNLLKIIQYLESPNE